MFASHFYFQDQKYRKVFTKGGQIHIIRDDRDNETGYQLKGEWKIEQQGQKLHHIYVNDFADHKNNFIKEIKEEIQNFLLKSDEYSRYSMLNFYKKIINTNNNLEIFLCENVEYASFRLSTRSIFVSA